MQQQCFSAAPACGDRDGFQALVDLPASQARPIPDSREDRAASVGLDRQRGAKHGLRHASSKVVRQTEGAHHDDKEKAAGLRTRAASNDELYSHLTERLARRTSSRRRIRAACAASGRSRANRVTASPSLPSNMEGGVMHQVDRMRSALYHIPPRDRDIWLGSKWGLSQNSAMPALTFGTNGASRTRATTPRTQKPCGRACTGNGKVTVGTLFHEAKAHGWRDDGTHSEGRPRKSSPSGGAVRRNVRAREEAEIACERAEAAKKAAAIWKAATEAKPDHPYLSRKRVSPGGDPAGD